MALEGKKKGVKHLILCVHIFNLIVFVTSYGLQQEYGTGRHFEHFVDRLCDASPKGKHCLSKPVKVFQSADELHISIRTVGLLGAVQRVKRVFCSSVKR